MMNQTFFEILFLLLFSIGFSLIHPENSFQLSSPLILGLLAAYAFQKYFKRGNPDDCENELDNKALSPSFWVAFGIRITDFRDYTQENRFLSFVAEKKFQMRLATFAVFTLVLSLNSAMGNAPRTWSFWLNLLQVVLFTKSITRYHYWLSLFLNVLATLVFYLTDERSSLLGLSIYLFLICLIFVWAKLKLTIETFNLGKSASHFAPPAILRESAIYTLLILLIGFGWNGLIPSKKPSFFKRKAHAVNVQWSRLLPKNSHETSLKNWSHAVQASKEVSEVEWTTHKSRIRRLQRALSGAAGSGGKIEDQVRALKALETLARGDEPTESELLSLEREIDRLQEQLRNPQSLNNEDQNSLERLLNDELNHEDPKELRPSEKAIFEEAQKALRSRKADRSVEMAADVFSKKLDPSIGLIGTPLIAPKNLNRLIFLIRLGLFAGFVVTVFYVLRKLLIKINPVKEKSEKEERERKEALQSCLDELSKLKRKRMSPREEIAAFYRLFLKIMSHTPRARPEFLPSENYSEGLEKDLPSQNESFQLTNKLFSRTLYSLIPISEDDLKAFRKHIEILFNLAKQL